MRIAGKDLKRIERAVELAKDEIHNRIATCPDVVAYADDIKELRAEKVRMELLLKKIQRGIAQEKDLEIKRQAKKEKRNA